MLAEENSNHGPGNLSCRGREMKTEGQQGSNASVLLSLEPMSPKGLKNGLETLKAVGREGCLTQ